MTDDLSNPAQPTQRSSDADTGPRDSEREPADALLLTHARDGDQRAMTELFDRYGTMVYSVALRVLHDPAQAEDVMQEIFFQVWRNPNSFVAGRGSLGAWLAVMARNRAIDSL